MTVYSLGPSNPDLTQDGTPMVGGLYEMAQELLSRIVDSAARLGTALPERRFVYASPVPADCPQVCVLMIGWTPTVVWDNFISCQTFKWAGQFSLVITRKCPALPGREGQAPPAASMNASGRISSDDADILVGVVQGLGEIGPEMTLLVGAPEGGLQSVELTVTLPVFGGLG